MKATFPQVRCSTIVSASPKNKNMNGPNTSSASDTATKITLPGDVASCPPQSLVDATVVGDSDSDAPQPHLHRHSDGHQVFPIWRTIRQLQTDECTAELITNHLQQQQRLKGWSLLDRSAVNTILSNMTADRLLIATKKVTTDNDTEEDEAADHVAGDDNNQIGELSFDDSTTFALPLSQSTDSSSTATTAADTDADEAYDDKSVANLKLLPECQISPERDAYCYECQHAGLVLHCNKCWRVFHADCVRSGDRLDLPLRAFREPVPELIQKTFQLTFDVPYSKSTATPKALPADARLTDDRLAFRWCVRCRLEKRNAQHLRPLTPLEDLNDLLRTSFKRIRSWLASDTFSTDEPKSVHIPTDYVQLLMPVLMAQPRTIADIAGRIADNAYRSLLEYRIDVMDVVHCVGVLRGTGSANTRRPSIFSWTPRTIRSKWPGVRTASCSRVVSAAIRNGLYGRARCRISWCSPRCRDLVIGRRR